MASVKNAVLISLFFVFASDVSSMYSSKAMEGYSVGFMSDCVQQVSLNLSLTSARQRVPFAYSAEYTHGPGSTNKAVVSKNSLSDLGIMVQGNGSALWARRRKYNYYQMKLLAKDPDVDFSRKTVLYVMGFLASPHFPMSWGFPERYARLGYNALTLDTNAFTTVEYPKAARMMRPVGHHVAEMLFDLTKRGLDPKRLELVGLSLGGQTMSFIAKSFKKLSSRSISRLTALDPSGPCFRNLGPEDRLDSSDADFVDVISTNIDGWGMAAPVGHFNVYVNGGEYQPGEIMSLPCTLFCSHVRAISLWLAILDNPKSFLAIECDSVQQAREKNCYDNYPLIKNCVGLETDRSRQGIFYLPTTNEFPYHMGEEGLKRENDFVTKYFTSLLNTTEVLEM